MKIFVTGATGFVGQALIKRLIHDGHSIVAVTRKGPAPSLSKCDSSIEWKKIQDLVSVTNWAELIQGCDALVHLAARVHVVNDQVADLAAVYQSANTDVTLSLASAAAQSGLKRFVFVSSLKACGESGTFDESSETIPDDAYGLSKRKAEIGLMNMAKSTGMEVVILRPPLIYGPGVKANFNALMKLVSKRIPLPLGSATNKRSLVFLGNFVDAIVECLTKKQAANQLFFVTDGDDVSTSEVIRAIAASMGTRPTLFSVPDWLIKSGLTLLGKPGHYNKLLGTLVAKSEKIRTLLDWRPPYTMQEGMDETVRSFLKAPK